MCAHIIQESRKREEKVDLAQSIGMVRERLTKRQRLFSLMKSLGKTNITEFKACVVKNP